jgi:hypothetical protein
MSVHVAYRAETVGPVVKRLTKEADGIIAVQEDDIDFSRLVSQRPTAPAALPPPVDPLLRLWEETTQAASDFANTTAGRTPVAKTGISYLRNQLDRVLAAIDIPAPTAPPPAPVAKWIPHVLVRWGSRRRGTADIEINSAEAVILARDKKESRRKLAGLCPETWFTASAVKTPCVIRPRHHHAGKKFFVCHNVNEVERAILKCGPGWYASALIEKAAEYRVFILQDRVIRVSTKHQGQPGEIAWNVGNGASAAGIARKNWPIPVLKAALEASRRLGLDWTAIDVATDATGKTYVLEANTAPGLQSGSKALEQISWAFAWIPKNDAPQAVNLSTASTWADFLHPSIAATLEG